MSMSRFYRRKALEAAAIFPAAPLQEPVLGKNKGGAFWLVTLPDEKRADLKRLPEKIGSKRLSFGNADPPMDALGVTPGPVTPLALINDARGACSSCSTAR